MRHSIGVVIAAALFLGVAAPAETQDLGGTLKKVRETGVITIGHRDGRHQHRAVRQQIE